MENNLWRTRPTRIPRTSALIVGMFLALSAPLLKADSTWIFAVQISAVLQSSPPQITLNWQPNEYGANSYTVYRKAKESTSWGAPLAALSGATLTFTDTSIAIGTTYEYRIVEQMAIGSVAYGYILTGINTPMIENRGTVVLLVETNATASLTNELARLQTDLIGDGWQVIRHGVSSNDTPAYARSLVVSDYNADPANVTAVFLFGHVPILHSGNLDYDGHGARPMPADAYYGEINGNWSGSPDFLPSDVELMVGRVDFFAMPGVGAPVPWPNETELLRNYLNKDHNWRFKLINVPRRALMADRFGVSDNNEPKAASGYRNFEPLVGPGNTYLADVEYDTNVDQRWISLLTRSNYLWTYACGGGFDTGISTMGLHGQYNDVWSTDVVYNDAHAVFFMLEGSHFGNWDIADNIMRSCLATPTMGLAVCCLAGHPHWFVHQMGLGETIGYGTRITMNNTTLYETWSNTFPRAIYITLLGDPTLRMEPVAPPSNLSANASGNGVGLTWTASADSVAGYHVYRAATLAGPFTRITSSLITGTSFTDTTVPAGDSAYMVRAVMLQANNSGSYFNPSEGVFTTANVAAMPIVVTPSLVETGLRLSWNGLSGTVYRVLAKTNLAETSWTDISGGIPAGSTTISWTNTGIDTSPQRFYRIASP